MGVLIVVLIGVVVVILVIIALSALFTDALRGAIGGRKTLERAHTLLVISTDDPTERTAGEWIERHVAEHPDVRCLPVRVDGDSEFEGYVQVQKEIDRYEPDALVWALHESRRHSEEGTYAMAKRELDLPMDAIYGALESDRSNR